MRIIKKVLHGFVFLWTMFVYFFSFPLAFILYGKKKYWLISEVDFDARDNGFHFFRYLNSQHKEINSVYLISINNPYYEQVKNIGEVIEPLSYKHMLVFIASRAKISTLVHGCSPSSYLTLYLKKFHSTGKNIALKHGIFKNLHPNYFKKNAHLDLICCGGKPEFDFINSCFGYNSGVAQYTGLARFDELHNFITEKQVLIMPTWRRWLDSTTDFKSFENSDYFKGWSSLLTSESFLNITKKYRLKVYFYIHPKLNRFKNEIKQTFNTISFLNSTDGDDLQTYLKTSSILITDFSSIFFDYGYMRKPVIFYQFDEKDYYKYHYEKGYFDYKRDGFGPVCLSKQDVLNNLLITIKNDSKISDFYLKRCNNFFPRCDKKNCERIYDSISQLINCK